MQTPIECPECRRIYRADKLPNCPGCSAKSPEFKATTAQSYKKPDEQSTNRRKSSIEISGRSAKQNREIAEELVNDLTQGSLRAKYSKSIKNGEFSDWSFIGTNDWQDYADLSIQALHLLAITRIDENLEKIVALLERDH